MRVHSHHEYLPVDGDDRLCYVGAPILHGYETTSVPQGTGGASRVAAASAGLNAGFPNDLTFFFWLVIIGVVIPGVLVGSLKAGGFQFVFRGR